MLRVAAILAFILVGADAPGWATKYTEHCIAVVGQLVRPPDKFKLLSEKFDREFGYVIVTVDYDKKDASGPVTRVSLDCEYPITQQRDFIALGLTLNGKRLQSNTVETINYLIQTEPE